MTAKPTLAWRIALVCAALSLTGACAARRARQAEEARILEPVALYQKGLEAIARGEFRRARTFLDRIQYAPEGRVELEPLVRLALADVAFYTGDDLSLIDALFCECAIRLLRQCEAKILFGYCPCFFRSVPFTLGDCFCFFGFAPLEEAEEAKARYHQEN